MTCDVCLYAPEDIVEFYRASTPRARKAHLCGECDAMIPVGDKYERAAGKSDGVMFVFKTCSLCAEVRTVFYCGGAYEHGTLWENMEGEAFPRLTTGSDCFQELSPAAKEYVMDKWRAWKFMP
jgi:hypothetical protein